MYVDDLALLDYLTTKKWWDELCRLGPKFYFPEGSKSWLVIRKNAEEHVESVFKHTNIMITTEDKMHLGTIIRTTDNRQNYMKEKIGQCITELRMLCKIVWYKPQAVYSFSITGFKRKPTYIMQTIPNINTQLEQLEEIVRTEFIPAISGGINSSDIE